jgi:hypothetical protein
MRHYTALVAAIGLLMSFAVPSAIAQIQEAVPTTSGLRQQARESSGIKQRVLLAIPFAAVLATVVDVVIRGREPAEEDVPAVLFAAKEAETSER